MATTLAQALALKKQNPNLSTRDAIAQVEGNTGTQKPAVTTTTPTPTIPTQNFPSQPINQQTTTGVNGENFQVAPVNQQGITPQVPTQQPTTPPQTPPPQATTPVDKTAEIQAKNQAQMEANAQKAQLAIQERKQQEADAKLAATPTDQKSILTSLISGVSVPQQNTAAYRNAQLQYKNYQKFNSMTPQQLLDNMKMGEIDTATSQLLANNPSYIKAKEDFDKFQKNQSINQMIKSVASGVTGKTETVDYSQQASDSLAKKLGIDQTNAEAYATIVSKNPEVVQLTQTVSNLTKQLNTLNTERNTVYADLKKQYPDLSASAIMTLMASRTKQTTDQIDALNSSLTLTTADLKTAMELAKGEYEATKEDIALQAGIAKEDRAMKNSLALAKAQNQILQGNASFQTIGDKVYKVQNGQMTDTGIKAEKDAQYQAYGGKLYKIKGDSVTEVPGIVTETPRAETQDWAKLDDTTLYNQRTGEIKKVSASEASTYGPSTIEVTPDAIKGLSSRLSGNNVQCGMVSNDYMAKYFPQAPRMGDSYESKVKSVEAIGVSDVPQVGGVFAMNTYNSNGHTGIVQSVDLAKGTFTATDANRAGSQNGGPVTTSTYNISDNFTFSKAPAGAGTIRPSDIDYFNSATATDKRKLSSNPQYIDFNNKKSIVMSDPNADIYEVMKFSQGGKDMGEERLKSLGKFSQGLSQVAELSKKIQEIQTGPIIGRIRSYNPYDANAQALLAEINATVPNIARGVYGEVGVLTDADIQNYAKTLPNIKSTEDTNKLVLAMTLKTMLNGFKGQIQIDGSAGRDVSGFAGTVKQYEDKINQLLSTLGGGNASIPSSSNYNFQSDWDNL